MQDTAHALPAWIFPSSKTGSPMSALPLSQRFRDIVRAAELPRTLSLYALRHTFASHCLAAGERPVTVAKWLGHSDVRTTYTFYAHALPDDDDQAAIDPHASPW